MGEGFSGWCVLELLGHVRLGGKVSEVEMFGQKMGRINIPHGDGFVSRVFGGAAVYSLTPCGEAEARAVAKASNPEPLHSWEVRQLLEDRRDGATSPPFREEDDYPMEGEPD